MLAQLLTLPAIFLGHGSPMNAIETNNYSKYWVNLGKSMPKPTSILAISAHWETDGVRVTSNLKQKTIHDFGGFPKALFDVEYNAPGSPELCKRIKELIPEVQFDDSWGLDHGTWSILKHIYPKADVPVVQLSLNARADANWHYQLAKKLKPLQKEGVLIIASGNIVHNLRKLDFDNNNCHTWAQEFQSQIKQAILNKDHQKLINYTSLPGAKLAVPSTEHYIPLLYIAALHDETNQPEIFFDNIEMGSLSMLSVLYRNI